MVTGSVAEEPFVPLGQQRLRTVELVLKMVQMKNENLMRELNESNIFSNITNLVKQYPWNNFLQLKVINIFTEMIENNENATLTKNFLISSGIGQAIVEMQKTADIKMESERIIRNGYMALVIQISNKLQKKYEVTERAEIDTAVVDYLDGVGEEWREFVDKELKSSNENNNKTLGGCTTRNNMSEEEDEKEDSSYDVQMEKIMARFSNFNQILSQTSGNDDDDDDDDEDTQEDKEDNFDEDDDKEDKVKERRDSDYSSDQGVKVQPVTIPEEAKLETQFMANSFWKVTSDANEDDIDSLLAELDS